jgi:tRNA(Ile)-lysidine synthase
MMVAVSGGPDSMALLAVLYQLRSVYNVTLVVAHINHQLRGEESTRDAVFVEHQAARLGLPFSLRSVDVKGLQRTAGLSPQHAARQLRYACLAALQRALGATHIALGHTADDQAETLLMRLLRGSSPAGFAGMPPVRLPCVRPLLAVSRDAIMAYLRAEGIPWVEDSSNSHPVYLRNRVRLHLLPQLRQYNPQIASRLNELADICRAEQYLLAQQTAQVAAQVVCWQPGKRVLMRCHPYSTAPLAVQRRLLRDVVDTLLPAAANASFRHIESLRRLMVHGAVGERCPLPGHWMAERHRDTTLLWHTQQLPADAPVRTLPVPGYVDIPELELRLSADIRRHSSLTATTAGACIDLAPLQLPLTVRFRRPGDRFYPLGAPGRRKLKAFLIDRKVPKAERDAVPLVISGSDIVWVTGYSIAEPYKVQPETRDIVRLRYETRSSGQP